MFCAVSLLLFTPFTRADKQAKKEEKQLIRQADRNKREAEKERIRLDRELKKERWQSVSPCLLYLILVAY